MIAYRKAKLEDKKGIIQVCADGYRNTYQDFIPKHHIENIIKEFYTKERIQKEILNVSQEWNGWFVAVEQGTVIGAGGGGFTGKKSAELYVLYLDPNRKREGIGTKLLAMITREQIERGAEEQWVSVYKNNAIGISFYEAVGFVCQGEQPSYELPIETGLMSRRYSRILSDSLLSK